MDANRRFSRRSCLIGVVLAGCRSRKAPPTEIRAEIPIEDAVKHARDEFEVLSGDYRGGTSKLYSRGDFLPLDDPKAMSEGDFIGRLRALFGPEDGDEYVLHHRATGFVVTAYAAQSGPSYGGGPKYSAKASDGGRMPSHAELLEESKAMAARIKADPVLAKGSPVDWSKNDPRTLDPKQLKALRAKEHAWQRRFADVAAPPGFDKVVARLDALLSSVQPADWDAIRYWSEDPSVSRVGVRNGVAFDEALNVGEGMNYLLKQAEEKQPAIKDTASGLPLGADTRVVKYWIYHSEQVAPIESALPRVQAAWFRLVKQAKDRPANLRTLILDGAKDQIVPLKLDRQKAEAALRAAS